MRATFLATAWLVLAALPTLARAQDAAPVERKKTGCPR